MNVNQMGDQIMLGGRIKLPERCNHFVPRGYDNLSNQRAPNEEKNFNKCGLGAALGDRGCPGGSEYLWDDTLWQLDAHRMHLTGPRFFLLQS